MFMWKSRTASRLRYLFKGLSIPVEIEALLQPKAGSVQLDVQIGRCDRQFLTHLGTRHFQLLTHQEQATQCRRQAFHTGVKHNKKLYLLKCLIGIAPTVGGLCKVPVGFELQPV